MLNFKNKSLYIIRVGEAEKSGSCLQRKTNRGEGTQPTLLPACARPQEGLHTIPGQILVRCPWHQDKKTLGINCCLKTRETGKLNIVQYLRLELEKKTCKSHYWNNQQNVNVNILNNSIIDNNMSHFFEEWPYCGQEVNNSIVLMMNIEQSEVKKNPMLQCSLK